MSRPNLGKLLANKARKPSLAVKVTQPARTRFAPSPTGNIHLGSLRTALYNYLLAKSTNGQFILRLEDTDRTRLKPEAEKNIYKSLEWTKIMWDEGPIKQSDRKPIYLEYAEKLLNEKKAYRCFCSKSRLDALAESARQLRPPSTASYDRKCSHISAEESQLRAENGESFVVRFKSPPKWPLFDDVLHGKVENLTQINQSDVRYDDFVILKSDKMPTYHFANVIDDSLMKITHVIRGEEWLASTPKHVALYNALNRKPPYFVHIPLLTGAGGKKLSKRKSDQGILELAGASDYIVPEALTNFVALLGWSPLASKRTSVGQSVTEVKSMAELENDFSLEGLTKGSIQVDFGKLYYLNKQHFERLMESDFDDAARRCHSAYPKLTLDETKRALSILKAHITCISDYVSHVTTVLEEPAYSFPPKDPELFKSVLRDALKIAGEEENFNPKMLIDDIVKKHSKKANNSLRYALLDGKSGTSIVETMELLGPETSIQRLKNSYNKIFT